MNHPENTIEYNSLSWVKKQLDDVLSDAQSNLNEYIESKEDGQLENCIEHLQLVNGTLQMVEVFGAAMLAEEMQHTTEALLRGNIENVYDAYEVLMRSLLQLPDYLESIQAGQKDTPITLMPLINDLRAVRKKGLLTEGGLFSPDIKNVVLVSNDYDANAIEPGKLQEEVKRLRTHFQLGLLDYLRNKKESSGLQRIRAVLRSLECATRDDEVRRLWMVIGALVECLLKNGIEKSSSIKMLLGSVDRQLKLIIDHGGDEFANLYSRELVINSLFYIGISEVDTRLVSAIREAYKLEELIPQKTEKTSAAIGGINAELFATVSRGIKEDIDQVKDVLELFMNSADRNVEQLAPIIEQLGKIADTYGMLGIGAGRQSIMDQRMILESIVNGEMKVDEHVVLDVASRLLNAESELNDYIAERTGLIDAGSANTDDEKVPAAEYRQMLFTIVSEALKSFSLAKDAILSYVSETGDRNQLNVVLNHLEEVRGVTSMLSLTRVEAQIEKLQRFICTALLDNNHITSQEEQDTIADVVTSVEYFIESLSEGRPGVEHALNAGEEAVNRLEEITRRYENIGREEVVVEEPAREPLKPFAEQPNVVELPVVAAKSVEPVQKPPEAAVEKASYAEEIAPQPEVKAPEPEVIASESELTTDVSEQAVAQTAAALPDINQYPIISEDADEEIVEIFIEEAVEVLAEIHEYLPLWRADAENKEALAEVRRGFHTLKGSGRLLGALLIGEFSWKFENLLNKVMENRIKVSRVLYQALEEAVSVLPQLIEQLKGNREPVANIAQLMSLADDLADGIEVLSEPVEMDKHVVSANESGVLDISARADLTDVVEDVIESESASHDEVLQYADTVDFAETDETLVDVEQLQPESEEALLDESMALPGAESEETDDVFASEPVFPEQEQLQTEVTESYAAEGTVLDESMAQLDVESEETDDALASESVFPEQAQLQPEVTETPAAEESLIDESMALLDTEIDDDTDEISAAEPAFYEAMQQQPEVVESHAAEASEIDETMALLDAETDTAGEAIEIEHAEEEPTLEISLDEIDVKSETDVDLDDAAESSVPGEDISEEVINIDPVLLKIYHDESMGYIRTIRQQLDDWTSGKQPLTANKDLLRAFHTLYGSARTAEILPIAELTGTAEKYIKARQEAGQDIIPEKVADVIREIEQAVSIMLDRVAQGYLPKLERALHEKVNRIVQQEIQAQLQKSLQENTKGRKGHVVFDVNDTAGDVSVDETTAVAANDQPATKLPQASDTIVHIDYSDIDDELIDIFVEEADELLESCENTLRNIHNDPGNTEYIHQLQRNMHTLKGGARMADLTPIGNLTHNLESLVDMVNDNRVSADDACFDLLQDALDVLTGMLIAVKHRESLKTADVLIKRIEMLMRGEVEEKRSLERLDVELSELDTAESEVIVEAAEADISAENEDIRSEYEDIRTEDQDIRTEDEETTVVEAEVSAADEHVPEFKFEQTAADLVADSDSQFDSGEIEAATTEVTETVIPYVPTEPEQQVHELAAAEATDTEYKHRIDDSDDLPSGEIRKQRKDRKGEEKQDRPRWGERATDVNYKDTQEQIRVRADLLNNLVNYAGEVNIYHARMSKQIADYRFNLSELSQTVIRLKQQLRNLEIETEIQIRSGYEKQSDNYDDNFDPLEMDQYSTLQQLTRSLSETAGDVDSINGILAEITRDAETLLVQESRISSDLQEGLMRTRMVRFGGLSTRMRRIVRQIARELGKEVELDIIGDEIEVDRTVLDRIIAPLEHMLRNAVAHGIETPEARKILGKNETGKIVVDVGRQGSDVIIKVRDDGAGINADKIRQKAISQGLIPEDSNLSDRDVLQFILHSGFTTVDVVTQVAGRGVGMDVVDSEIKQLGGVLEIDTIQGRSTEFKIRLPLTLAINQALLVSAADDVYAIPITNVEGVVRTTGIELQGFYDSENSHYEFNGVEYELKHLGALLTGNKPDYSKQLKLFPVLLVHVGDKHFALHVEDLIGRREIVVKPVGLQIGSVHGIAGASILADGRLVLILEMTALVVADSLFKPKEITEAPQQAVDEAKTIMVVDDSITIRKITERILKRYGLEVILAKDGVDATNLLQEFVPDLILLDIEMPRMDGFEVAGFVRNDQRLKDIPIIMITSRTGNKHKKKAMSIGVNQYLGKPFQEDDLLKNINNILETSFSLK